MLLHFYQQVCHICICLSGLVVKMLAFHADSPGSSLSWGGIKWLIYLKFHCWIKQILWSNLTSKCQMGFCLI